MRRTVFLAIALAFAASCGDAASESDCKKLLDHLVDVEVNAGGGAAVSPELEGDRDAVRKKVREYLEKDFLETCKKNLPKSQVDCGLKAKTAADVAACDESRS